MSKWKCPCGAINPNGGLYCHLCNARGDHTGYVITASTANANNAQTRFHKGIRMCECGKESEYIGMEYWYDKCRDCWWAQDPRNPKAKAEKAQAIMSTVQAINKRLQEMGVTPKFSLPKKRKP